MFSDGLVPCSQALGALCSQNDGDYKIILVDKTHVAQLRMDKKHLKLVFDETQVADLPER